MFVICVYFMVYFSTLSVQSYRLNKTLCQGPSCLHLYDMTNAWLSWEDSYTACKEMGLELLSIDSNKIQTFVDNLLKDLPPNTARKVWVAGRRSTDDKWRYMNGTEFNEPVAGYQGTPSNCMYVRLCKDSEPEYYGENCDEKHASLWLLCQHGQEGCKSSDLHSGNQCYVKTIYTGMEDKLRIDWYSGETYCSKNDIQGEIAYSYLDNKTLQNDIINYVNGSVRCISLWLGVRRRIWFWETGANRITNKEPIKYFNWENITAADFSYDLCIYVDADKGNKWSTQSCSDPPLKYFICRSYKSSQTEIPSTSSTMHTTISNTSASSKLSDTQEENFNLVYIAPIILSVIVVAGIIGVTVFFIRKKRRQKADEHHYVNEDFHQPTTGSRSNDDPGYANIALSQDQEGAIDQYDMTSMINVTEMRQSDNKPSENTEHTATSTAANHVILASGTRRQDTEGIQYEMLGEQCTNMHNSANERPHINKDEEIYIKRENEQYEKPSTYVNMIDRPNVYESLKT